MKQSKLIMLCGTVFLSLSFAGETLTDFVPKFAGIATVQAAAHSRETIGNFPNRVVAGDIAPDQGTLTIHKYYLRNEDKGDPGSNGLAPEDPKDPTVPEETTPTTTESTTRPPTTPSTTTPTSTTRPPTTPSTTTPTSTTRPPTTPTSTTPSTTTPTSTDPTKPPIVVPPVNRRTSRNAQNRITHGPEIPKDAVQIRNIEFEIFQIVELWKLKNTGGNEYLASNEEKDRYKAPPGGTDIIYELTEEENQGVLRATAKDGTVYTYKLGKQQSGRTDDKGQIRFGTEEEGLPRGYYFVTEKHMADAQIPNGSNDGWQDVAITKPMAPFVTAIPLTHPDKDKWIQDVHIYPKNASSELEKEASETDVSIGDEINYSLKLEIPSASVMTIKDITLWDKLDDTLDFISDSVTIKRIEAVDDDWEYVSPEQALISGTDYTVTEPSVANAKVLTIQLTADGVAKVTADGDAWEGLAADFATVVNKNLVLRPVTDEDGQIIKNKATAEFEDEGGNTIQHGSNETETPSGEIIIEKINQNGAALGGAEFKLAASKEDAKAGRFIRIDPSTLKLYYYDEPGYDDFSEWVVTSAVTSDGKKAEARFDGLQLTDDAGRAIDYWGMETKAPKGYNLLKDPIHFGEIQEKNGESVIRYSLDKAVVNTDDFQLPETGSFGAVLLTILGMIVIGMAFMMKIFGKNSQKAS